MKNDFTLILSELSKSLTSKVDELTSSGSYNDINQDKVRSLNRIVDSLKISAEDILQNYPEHQDMLINFKKRANEVLKEIEELC